MRAEIAVALLLPTPNVMPFRVGSDTATAISAPRGGVGASHLPRAGTMYALSAAFLMLQPGGDGAPRCR